MVSYNFGDIVNVVTDEERLTGRVMPRPTLLGRNVLVLKLENGYNIGIDEGAIKEVRVIEKYVPVEPVTEAYEKDPALPDVSVLSIGGTISSRIDYFTGGVSADYSAEDFVRMLPELRGVANITARKVMGVMSEDMTSDDWVVMADAIVEELNNGADGVVVTQGTDTLHFSTAAMSFMLQDLGKPVVFTASQRSIDRGSSDAFMNLYCAVVAAARFDGAMVMTCLHGSSDDEYCLLIRGTKVRKMHTSRRDAFRSVNDKPLARVYSDGRIEGMADSYVRRRDSVVVVKNTFEKKVGLVYVYPGFDASVIDFYVNNGYKGIVIAGTALGHVSTRGEATVIPALRRATDAGVILCMASQTLYGEVHPYVYSNLRKLSMDLGIVYLRDMLPEVAYVKLGWVLKQAQDEDQVKRMMVQNIAGEITDRTLADTFLI